MASGIWPEGSVTTMTYPFDLKIDGKSVFPFTIYDYRGGMLNGLSDEDQDDVEEIFDTFEESSCIVILVDGDTIMQALEPGVLSPTHRQNVSFAAQLKARNEVNYIESLVKECNERMSRNVPILLAITKSDIFFPDELDAGNTVGNYPVGCLHCAVFKRFRQHDTFLCCFGFACQGFKNVHSFK